MLEHFSTQVSLPTDSVHNGRAKERVTCHAVSRLNENLNLLKGDRYNFIIFVFKHSDVYESLLPNLQKYEIKMWHKYKAWKTFLCIFCVYLIDGCFICYIKTILFFFRFYFLFYTIWLATLHSLYYLNNWRKQCSFQEKMTP